MKGMNFFSVLPSQPRTKVEIDSLSKHTLTITVASYDGDDYENASRVSFSFYTVEELNDLVIRINEAYLTEIDKRRGVSK